MNEELMNTVEENIETIELEPEVGTNKLGLVLGLGLLGLAGAGVAFGIKKLKSKKDKIEENPEMVETEDTDDDFEDDFDSDSDEENR